MGRADTSRSDSGRRRPTAPGWAGERPLGPSAALEASFAVGRVVGGSLCQAGAAVASGGGELEQGGRRVRPVLRRRRAPGCHGPDSRLRALAGLVSSARPATVDTASGSPATPAAAARPQADKALGRLGFAGSRVEGARASARPRGTRRTTESSRGSSAACSRPRGGARVHGMGRPAGEPGTCSSRALCLGSELSGWCHQGGRLLT